MAKELASRGVRVNAVAPGFIETDMTKVLSEDIQETIPPTINYENPDEECDLNYTPNQAVKRDIK